MYICICHSQGNIRGGDRALATSGDVRRGASQARDRLSELLQDRGASLLGPGLAGARVPARRGLVRLHGRPARRAAGT